MFSGTLVSNSLWIAVFVACALCSAIMAQKCGREFWPWFWAGLFFGPLTLIVELLFVVPKRVRRAR